MVSDEQFFDAKPEDDSQEEIDFELAERIRLIRRQAMAATLEIILADATPKQAGQRAFLLAHFLKLGKFAHQKDLARALKISQGRASQILKRLKLAFPR